MSIGLIALGVALFALVLAAIGVGDLKRDLGGKVKKLEKKGFEVAGLNEKVNASISRINDRDKVMDASLREVDVLRVRMDALKARVDEIEAPTPAKPAKKARRNSKGQYTKRAKS